MESNTHHSFQLPSSGLLRLSSAPGSLNANISEGSESQRLISRFMNYSRNSTTDSESSPRFQEFEDKSSITTAAAEVMNWRNSQHGFSGLPPHYPRQSSSTSISSSSFSHSSSAMDASYGLMGSNISRQSSSPAGLFSHLSLPNGYANYRAVNGNKGGEISPASNKSRSQLSLSSSRPPPSSLGILSQILEVENESILGNSPSWSNDSSPSFMENYSGFRRERDNQMNNGEIGHNRVHLLSHHLSLPKSSSDVVAVEKMLQFQDAVPCKIRAKRGCATHPRSIAERVRRTRISERMRKLQELVPNMDKQTNTADMLDLAVNYIKDLQKQFQTLSDNRAKCKCLSIQKTVSNQIV